MKTIARAVFVVATVLGGTVLLAIPTSVGGVFQNGAGNDEHEPVETWFANPKHWLPGATLPGPWISLSGRPGEMQLENPGAVFGIPARSVTVSRDAKGGIREISVLYDKETAKSAAGHLLNSLSTNVAVAIGARGYATQGLGNDRSFEGKIFDVLLHPDGASSQVVARLKLKGA